jgi:hypothetical protein
MTAGRTLATIAFALSILGVASCRSGERPEATDTAPAAEAGAVPPVVEVTAVDYAFQAPAEIPAGWSTFRLTNSGREEHFMSLWRLPDGRTLEDYERDVGPAFAEAYRALEAGTADKAQAGAMLGEALPEWYGSVVAMGGPGLVAPGGVASTTVRLDPGVYVMECYVKTAEGEFHSMLGMIGTLVVTDDSTTSSAPETGVELMVSNAGIAGAGPLPSGERTIAVRFQEQPAVGLGNDVHLVRLADGTDLDRLAAWMDWMNLDGLRTPAPAQFLGGAQEMPPGHTAYVTAEVAPGRYAWVSEPRGWVEEFTVE